MTVVTEIYSQAGYKQIIFFYFSLFILKFHLIIEAEIYNKNHRT